MLTDGRQTQSIHCYHPAYISHRKRDLEPEKLSVPLSGRQRLKGSTKVASRLFVTHLCVQPALLICTFLCIYYKYMNI